LNLRRSRYLIWGLAAVSVVALLFAITQYREARASNTRLEAAQQRALFTLISHVENVEGNLAKAQAAGSTAQQVTFLTASWSHSMSAADYLAQFAAAGTDLTPLRSFLATVGDYSMVLSQKVARGDTVTSAEWAELARLEASVKDLAGALASTGRAFISSNTNTRTSVNILTRSFAMMAAPQVDPITDGFSEIDTMVQSVPAPVYDGPFSESNQSPKPLIHKGEPITAEKAKEIALAFLTPNENFESIRVEETAGTIPTFMVTSKRSDGSEVTTAVAKEGGSVLWAQDSANTGPAVIHIDSARRAANAFLQEKGFTNLVETGWRRNSATSSRVMIAYVPQISVNLGGRTHEVKLYPDTVKIEVSLADGKIMAFDQRSYLTSHKTRNIPDPMVESDQAKKQLRSSLQVQGEGHLVVIPLLPSKETLAWEFHATSNTDTYLVYINAMTGKEDVVLQVIRNEWGDISI
jgi:spore germination protein